MNVRTDVEVPGEKPLSDTARLSLAFSAGIVILLFYLFAVVSIIGLLLVLGVELLVFLALARFGLAGLMAKAMQSHLARLPVFFRSLWVGRGAEFRVPLRPEEAPGAYAILRRLCDQLGVGLPQSVALAGLGLGQQAVWAVQWVQGACA